MSPSVPLPDSTALAGSVSGKLKAVLADDDVTKAAALAAGAADFVISSRDDAALASDWIQQVRRGRLALEKEYDAATAPLRKARDVIAGWINPKIGALKSAEAVLKTKWDSWQREEEDKARREREEAARLAAAAAEQAKAEAEAFGEDEAPPAAVMPVAQAERVVHGRSSVTYTTERLTFVEVVDWAEVAQNAPQVLSVNSRSAEALYRAAEQSGAIDADKPLVLYGMRFIRRRTVGNR